MKLRLLIGCCILLTFFATRYYYYTSNTADLDTALVRADCHKQHKLNSQEYWNCRFKTQDWQDNHGDEQSLHFYTLMVNGIPEHLQQEIAKNHYTIGDFGCAQGEGTEYFSQMFPNASVTGVDISSEGVAIAAAKHHKANFIATDLTQYNGSFDIIISSNTLEHFYEPWSILTLLSHKARRYMIILVPFDQPGIPSGEHFYSFNHQNILHKVGDFRLNYSKIIHPDPKFWNEKQILLIYKKI